MQNTQYLLLEYFEKSVQCIILHSDGSLLFPQSRNQPIIARKTRLDTVDFFALKVIILH